MMLREELPTELTIRLHHHFESLTPPPADIDMKLAQLLQLSCLFPVEFLKDLLAFRAAPDAPGALLITGMPVDSDLPPTPSEGAQPPYKSGTISESSILSIAVLLGEPIAYRAEKGGALVQDVFPTRSSESVPSNESSSVSLGFHTELTFSRREPERPLHVGCPDFVLLLGLRCPAERSAVTQVVEARDLSSHLTEHQLVKLRQPEFQLQAPYSFTRDGDGSRPWSPPVALLHGPARAPSLAFDSACGIRALSPEAEDALDALRVACDDSSLHRGVQLGAGDLLVINNSRCAHARSQFPARFDGNDRWLQRVYVRRSIWDLASDDPESYRILN
jgi:L-asparagine oxygenase